MDDSTYAGTWGYSVAANTTITSDAFVGLTNELTQIFDKDTASVTGGDSWTVYYGVSVNASTPAGIYTMADNATAVYYLVARPGFEVVGNPTGWTNQSVALEVVPEETDGVDGYSFDDGATWQSSPTTTFETNTSDIRVRIRNTYGWVSPSKTINITGIDKVAPTMTFDNDVEYNSDHTTKQVTTLIVTLGENTSVVTGINVSDDASGVASGWPKCYRNNVEITSTIWTMNGRTGSLLQNNDFWVIDNDLGGHFEVRLYSNTQQYRVVIYLKNDTILSGSGSSSDPYMVEDDWAWFDGGQILQ